MRKLKTTVIFIIFTLIATVSSGCTSEEANTLIYSGYTNLYNEVSSRIADNMEYLTALYEAGFIDTAQYKTDMGRMLAMSYSATDNFSNGLTATNSMGVKLSTSTIDIINDLKKLSSSYKISNANELSEVTDTEEALSLIKNSAMYKAIASYSTIDAIKFLSYNTNSSNVYVSNVRVNGKDIGKKISLKSNTSNTETMIALVMTESEAKNLIKQLDKGAGLGLDNPSNKYEIFANLAFTNKSNQGAIDSFAGALKSGNVNSSDIIFSSKLTDSFNSNDVLKAIGLNKTNNVFAITTLSSFDQSSGKVSKCSINGSVNYYMMYCTDGTTGIGLESQADLENASLTCLLNIDLMANVKSNIKLETFDNVLYNAIKTKNTVDMYNADSDNTTEAYNVSKWYNASNTDTNSNFEKLKIITTTTKNEINDILDYKVYTIDSSKVSSVSDASSSIQAAVADYKSNGKMTSANRMVMNDIFKSSGETLKSLSGVTDELVVSTKTPVAFNGAAAVSYSSAVRAYSSMSNKYLYDIPLYQYGILYGALKVQQFNPDAVDRLISTLKSSEGTYFVDRANKRVYLMEYDVNSVSSMSLGKDIVKLSTDSSFIKYNFLKGNLKVKSNNGYSEYLPGLMTSGSVQIVKGSSSTCKLGDSNLSGVPTLVLRDYIESVYCPVGVVATKNYVPQTESEQVIATGRIIHLNTVEYSSKNGYYIGTYSGYIASMLNSNRKVIKDSNGADVQVNYYEMIDYKSIINKKPSILRLLTTDEVKSGKTATKNKNKVSEGDSSKGGVYELPIYSINSIKPVTYFTCPYLDTLDITNNSAGPVYSITLGINLTDNELFSGWINSDSTASNSILYWNSLLAKLGYKYTIDLSAVLSYVEQNYSYELSQNGVVIQDLDTIRDIQKDMDTASILSSNKLMRGVAVSIGYAFIALAVLILAFWAFDANTGLGINLLSKIPFCNWVAIRSRDESMAGNTGDTKLMTFSDILIKSLIFIAVGMFLIVFDVFSIVAWLVGIFGGISTAIGNLISGGH